MYTDCVSCDRDLGRNNELPGFPVGRRIAFDQESGRLWVICPHCEEWNLAVLETRWEAVEAAERLAATAEARAGSAKMGLARTSGGLELLRVGGMPRADIANWRYGRILRRRRRWTYATIAGLGLLVAVVGAWATAVGRTAFLGYWVGTVLGYFVWFLFKGTSALLSWGRTSGGRRWFAWGFRLRRVSVELAHKHGEPVLVVPGVVREVQYIGRDALEILARLLARRNWASMHEADVPDAVEWVDIVERRRGKQRGRSAWRQLADAAPGGYVMEMPLSQQLALEMALREELDRLDMEREAASAHAELATAEEVGAISDDLLLPERILNWIRTRRR